MLVDKLSKSVYGLEYQNTDAYEDVDLNPDFEIPIDGQVTYDWNGAPNNAGPLSFLNNANRHAADPSNQNSLILKVTYLKYFSCFLTSLKNLTKIILYRKHKSSLF